MNIIATVYLESRDQKEVWMMYFRLERTSLLKPFFILLIYEKLIRSRCEGTVFSACLVESEQVTTN